MIGVVRQYSYRTGEGLLAVEGSRHTDLLPFHIDDCQYPASLNRGIRYGDRLVIIISRVDRRWVVVSWRFASAGDYSGSIPRPEHRQPARARLAGRE